MALSGSSKFNSEPMFFTELPAGNIQCDLCPRRCNMANGTTGLCGVRKNEEGYVRLDYNGFITSFAMDPIEKKPLYHFRPGIQICSVGFAGCNLRCPYCQNWKISQSIGDHKRSIQGSYHSAGTLINFVKKTGKTSHCIAYTYSEPLVHIEFLIESMRENRKAGIANILVSNGCINPDGADEVLRYTDAANIDLKCFSEKTYKNVLGGELATVLSFIQMAYEFGVHLELTTLIVPGLNDRQAELDRCRDFIADLEGTRLTKPNAYIPWHLSAYHPNYILETPGTDPDFIVNAAARASEKVKFVYTGNIPRDNDTVCIHCGEVLVKRRGYDVDTSSLSLKKEGENSIYYCAKCKNKVPIRY